MHGPDSGVDFKRESNRRALSLVKELLELCIRQQLATFLFQLPHTGADLFDQLPVRQDGKGLLPALELLIAHEDGSRSPVFGDRDLFGGTCHIGHQLTQFCLGFN